MKTIALFGATGRSGQQFLTQALAAGYSIKALIRDPKKLGPSSGRLETVVGDVLKPGDVEKTVAGTDIVVSLFGHVKGSPEWLQTNGTRNIVAAMQKHGVERIISLSGGALPFPEKDEPKLIDRIFSGAMKLFMPKMINDAVRHSEVLRDSGLQWTIVRGPRLTDAPKKGEYRVSWVGVNSGTQLGRADLADFILKQVESEAFNGQMPFVSD